jgi:hypothetical protein
MATRPHAPSVHRGVSPNKGPAISSMSSGCSAPITVALATLVSCRAVKKKMMSARKATAPQNERRSSRQVTRPPATRNAPVISTPPIQRR